MNEPALIDAAQTDLPSPKPNRRKRLALRFAVLIAAVSALGAAYWFTRPPELIRFTTNKIGHTELRLSALVPFGWRLEPTTRLDDSRQTDMKRGILVRDTYQMVDGEPELFRPFLPRHAESGSLIVLVQHESEPINSVNDGTNYCGEDGQFASRFISYPKHRLSAYIRYDRTNLPAFNRTYRQICNSLMIE